MGLGLNDIFCTLLSSFYTVNHSVIILDINDKDQITCPVASSIQLMSLTYSKPESKSLSKKSENVTAEDGKDNTTLPATSLENRETNATASSGKAEREVNEIMENGTNKRRELIALIWVILTVKN